MSTINVPAGCQKAPSYEFMTSVNGNIHTQIPFSSKKDAVAYYKANATGLKAGDRIRMQLRCKGRVWKDTWQVS